MAGSGLQRFWSWLRGDAAEAKPAEDTPSTPVILGPRNESWLRELASEAAEGRRREEVAGHEFWKRVTELWTSGHERLASEWIAKFINAEATTTHDKLELRARFIEMLYERGDLSEGIEHLEVLARHDDYAVRANFLLAEHYRIHGIEAKAIRHYEAVVARDVAYPHAMSRLQRLREKRGHKPAGSVAATIAGGDRLQVGIGTRYELIRELGRGATAVVYLARDVELQREVAVKLLHPHLASATERGALDRFFTEARLAASLRHPNIVAILDIDEASRRLVMELGAGGTLRELIRQHGALDVISALERHTQLLSALFAAHERGIVHRDVKPGNLMFRRDPSESGVEIVLGDFGVANLPEGDEHTQDETRAEAQARGSAVGTLAYMAPEQRQAAAVDGRADIYSAAIVLFEMLCGRHPLPRSAVLAADYDEAHFALPSTVAASLPPDLAKSIDEHLRSLASRDLSMRPTSGEALAAARQLRDRAIASLAD